MDSYTAQAQKLILEKVGEGRKLSPYEVISAVRGNNSSINCASAEIALCTLLDNGSVRVDADMALVARPK